MTDIASLKHTAKKYLQARKEFLDIADKSDILSGNDNLVGRIGEFIAYQYLLETNRKPIRPTKIGSNGIHKTNKGFDFLCDNRKTMVSVKCITSENKAGTTTVIEEPWDELILILINQQIKVECFGVLLKDQFNQALKDGHIKSKRPYTRRTMLGKGGLISIYGNVIDNIITKKYL